MEKDKEPSWPSSWTSKDTHHKSCASLPVAHYPHRCSFISGASAVHSSLPLRSFRRECLWNAEGLEFTPALPRRETRSRLCGSSLHIILTTISKKKKKWSIWFDSTSFVSLSARRRRPAWLQISIIKATSSTTVRIRRETRRREWSSAAPARDYFPQVVLLVSVTF